MRKKLNLDHLTLGVCYYPEHWDPSLWQDDLRRMKGMGIETVRVAEFAWNYFEPHEGEFTFAFFDSFLELALQEGIKVIFCTPTATPPAWMSRKYPEILNADIDGHLVRHGARRHYNMNSEKYRFFVSRITQKLGEHYGNHPSIVAWQLDNEINCECDLYYSESDHRAFREWLRQKFGTLEALNSAIGASFWNQTYTDWEEVFLTRRTNQYGYTNPHMELLERHFIADTVYDFFKLQADILRSYTKAFITTNGLFRHVDYHRLTDEVIDFFAYDSYSHFNQARDESYNTARRRGEVYRLAKARSISPIFGVMEQQSGPGGWVFFQPVESPRAGYLRLWALQSVANGADYVSFFRWRTCTFGEEIYWHGILNYDNKDNRRVEEVKRTWQDLQRIQEVCGKEYVAELALLCDYDNEFDGEKDRWHGDADGWSYSSWSSACQKAHVPFQIVYINDDTALSELKNYRMVVYPHPSILTEKRAALLREYAQEGGTVLFGCRTGYKDIFGRCPMRPMPGYAAELCGVTVDDFTAVSGEGPGVRVSFDGKSISAPCFNDILTVTDGEAVGVYEDYDHKGRCAVSQKRIGKGKVYYFGAAFAEDTVRAFLDREKIGAPMGLDREIELPEGVGLTVRGDCIFLLNYTEEALRLPVSTSFHDLIRGVDCDKVVELAPFDVAVLKKTKA